MATRKSNLATPGTPPADPCKSNGRTPGAFNNIFRTHPGGPLNELVLQEEHIRLLAQHIVEHSPELAEKMAIFRR